MTYIGLSKKLLKLNNFKNLLVMFLVGIMFGLVTRDSVPSAFIFAAIMTVSLSIVVHIGLVLNVNRRVRDLTSDHIYFCQTNRISIVAHIHLLVVEGEKVLLKPFDSNETVETNLHLSDLKGKNSIVHDNKDYHLIKLR